MTGHVDGRGEAAGFAGAIQAVVQRARHVVRLHAHASLGSTNEEAMTLARAGAPHGTLVIADRQTAGRGRLGRRWESPPVVGLWFSWILRPELTLERSFLITAAGAVAVADAVARTAGRHATIRWPNDVMVRGRKLAGLLAEACGGGRLEAIILGVGINVNQREADFPEFFRSEATSLAIESGRTLDRALVLAAFLESFEFLYEGLGADGGRRLLDDWRARTPMLNRRVSITLPDRSFDAVVHEIADDGALVVEAADGTAHRLHAGDVKLLREAS